MDALKPGPLWTETSKGGYYRIDPQFVEDLCTIIALRVMECDRAIQRMTDKGAQNAPDGRKEHLQYYRWSKSYMRYFADQLKRSYRDLELLAVRPHLTGTVSAIIEGGTVQPATTLEAASHVLSQLARQWHNSAAAGLPEGDRIGPDVAQSDSDHRTGEGESDCSKRQPDVTGQKPNRPVGGRASKGAKVGGKVRGKPGKT